ncbi:MAG: universal stress protein [Actinobacteria bacterium]|nr:universal stress protein [Actinomycetota bacterium]
MSDKDFNWTPRRILIGYDGGLGAKDAVELCRAIAPEDAYVAVVNVLPYPGAPSETFHLMTSAEFPLPEDFFEPVTSRLPGREIKTFTYVGDSPARVFERHVHEEDLDLIVVGSPHLGAIGRIVIGSVGEALLHGAPVPVATAPQGYADRAHEGGGKVAVAFDGGEESQAALAHAASLAGARGAELEVLTVERPTDPVRGAIAYTMSMPEDTEDIQRQARDEVDSSIDLHLRTLHGPTADALAEACEDSDLLVVGSRGYGTVERVLLGSVSGTLIRKAPCPVIVVPRPAMSRERVRQG